MIAALLVSALFGPPAPIDKFDVIAEELRIAKRERFVLKVENEITRSMFLQGLIDVGAGGFDLASTGDCFISNVLCSEANPRIVDQDLPLETKRSAGVALKLVGVKAMTVAGTMLYRYHQMEGYKDCRVAEYDGTLPEGKSCGQKSAAWKGAILSGVGHLALGLWNLSQGSKDPEPIIVEPPSGGLEIPGALPPSVIQARAGVGLKFQFTVGW